MSEKRETRDELIQSITQKNWDVIVIGGGILGAAVALETARAGQNVLLLEQRDFAWGTSSRSSKMVHGGLRYLASGDMKLTRDSVEERQHLLSELPGLVKPLRYLFSHRKGRFPGPFVFGVLIRIYDFFAKASSHQLLRKDHLTRHAPYWEQTNLLAATQYMDAATDDARLVLRVLDEARLHGALCVNYARVDELLKQEGQVKGVRLTLQGPNETETLNIHAKAVVSATGPWADKLRQQQGQAAKIRPLRGSHIVFPYWRLPVSQSITFMHPQDKRPVFVFPWEGTTIVGTTDLDHQQPLEQEAAMSLTELAYLLSGASSEFPQLHLSDKDIVSSWAGVRGVVASGKGLSPSAESREHSIWDDQGLISVTGGKLTTFRLIALDVLAALKSYLPNLAEPSSKHIFTTPLDEHQQQAIHLQCRRLIGSDGADRIIGRYGYVQACNVMTEPKENLQRIPGTETYWFELRWAANEQVLKLEDLLLRRTRLGLQLAQGGSAYFERIAEIVLPELGWSPSYWQQEIEAYQNLWQQHYHPLGNTNV